MLEQIVILFLLVHGVYVVTRKGSLLGCWQIVVSKKEELYPNAYPHYLHPLSECTCCMNSFWGLSYFYWVGQVDQYIYVIFVASYFLIGMLVEYAEWAILKYNLMDKDSVGSFLMELIHGLYIVIFCAALFLGNPSWDSTLLVILCSSGLSYLTSSLLRKIEMIGFMD